MSKSSIERPKFLGSKLKQIRERWNSGPLTQEELANKIQNYLTREFGKASIPLNREYISGYERGTRTMPLIILLAYAQLSNTFVEVLIDDRLFIESDLQTPFVAKYSGVKHQ